MQHSSITLEVYLRKVWKLLLRRLHHSDDIRVKSYVRIILGHPINTSTVQLMKGLGTREHPLKSQKKSYDCDRLHARSYCLYQKR